MAVHRMRAGEQRPAEVVGADGQGDRQPDGRPERVAPAHPVPKAEGGGDAELGGGLDIGRRRDEMPGDVGTPLASNQAFAACALAIVSCVVKVLLAMTNKVSRGFSWRSTGAMSWPSTFETK
jgi:hypothetical protein